MMNPIFINNYTALVQEVMSMHDKLYELIETVEELKGNQNSIDTVRVVRCRDCKYMTEHYDTDGNAPYWTCSEWDAGTDYDGFCHYAERKDEE